MVMLLGLPGASLITALQPMHEEHVGEMKLLEL